MAELARVRDRMNRAPREVEGTAEVSIPPRRGGLLRRALVCASAFTAEASGRRLLGSAGVGGDRSLHRVTAGRARSSSAVSANQPTGFASVWPHSQSGTRGIHPAALTGAEP